MLSGRLESVKAWNFGTHNGKSYSYPPCPPQLYWSLQPWVNIYVVLYGRCSGRLGSVKVWNFSTHNGKSYYTLKTKKTVLVIRMAFHRLSHTLYTNRYCLHFTKFLLQPINTPTLSHSCCRSSCPPRSHKIIQCDLMSIVATVEKNKNNNNNTLTSLQ